MIRFSVLLPVRNGWPYVQECVQSVLAQSYPELRLHVLDNCSQDQTASWLQTVRDPRLEVSRSEVSLSITDSWARIRGTSRNEFMTLIGHDDVLDVDFLGRIKQLIEQHPDAALYQTGSRLINEAGQRVRACRTSPRRETAAGYLEARLRLERDVSGTGYVMRSADYDRVGGIPAFERLFFADDALWLTLLRGSYKAYDPAESFGVRIHPKSESASLPSAWAPILRGVEQFADFLHEYVRSDPQCAELMARYGPHFLLTYHRYVYIYALVEASHAGRRIDPSAVDRIRESLRRSAPSVAQQLGRSPKVAALACLNATPLRTIADSLWRLYYSAKTRSA